MSVSRLDLFEDVSVSAVELLQSQLAAAIDLATQAKQAHWNVGGPNCVTLYKMFGVVAFEVARHADLIAQRIIHLGGFAEGTVRVVSERSVLPAYPLTIRSGLEHIDALSSALASFGRSLLSAINLLVTTGDQNTADMLAEIYTIAVRLRGLGGVYKVVDVRLEP